MLTSGITLVRLPVVLRIFFSQLVHIVVAVGFGKDAGSCYRQVFAIALNDAGMGEEAPSILPRLGESFIGFEAVAVNDDGFRTNRQLV